MAKKENRHAELVSASANIEAPYELPEGWKWEQLEELSAIPITDGTHKTPTYSNAESGIPFISAKDVTKEYIDWSNIKYITKELHTELYKRIAPQVDDILLAKNGTTGVAAIVDIDKVFDLYVTLAVIRPNQEKILPRYLLRVINSPICKNQFDEHLTGIGVPNLHLRDIKVTQIPLPPTLAEQQRIVNRIETMFSKLDQAQEKAQSVLDSFETRKAAILHKAFTGELTANWRKENGVADDSWEEKTVGDCCSEVKVGIVIKPTRYYTEEKDGIPAFRSANVRENHIDDFDWVYINDEGMKNEQRSIVHTNDVLVVRSGAPGTACVVTEQFDGYNAIDILIAVPLQEVINSYFLCYYTNSPMGKNIVAEKKRGLGLTHFNVKGYSATPIKVPSILEQNEIVRILDSVLDKEIKANETAEKVIEQIDLLKKSILARAFRGKI